MGSLSAKPVTSPGPSHLPGKEPALPFPESLALPPTPCPVTEAKPFLSQQLSGDIICPLLLFGSPSLSWGHFRLQAPQEEAVASHVVLLELSTRKALPGGAESPTTPPLPRPPRLTWETAPRAQGGRRAQRAGPSGALSGTAPFSSPGTAACPPLAALAPGWLPAAPPLPAYTLPMAPPNLVPKAAGRHSLPSACGMWPRVMPSPVGHVPRGPGCHLLTQHRRIQSPQSGP